MATNKNASIRYQVLDRCFRNPGRKHFWQDLLEACNDALYEFNGEKSSISRRQLFDDIKYMESEQGWSIPLARHKDGRRVFYRYEDLYFSINNQPLNEEEVLQLRETILMLERLKGFPQLEWLQELRPRLEQAFQLDASQEPVLEYESNPYLKGLSHLEIVFQAIQYKKVLRLTYKAFHKSEAEEHVFHPYYLKQYNSRWFALGFNPQFDNLSIFPLDRLLEITETNLDYIENQSTNFQEYFEDVIGVTKSKDAQLETIEIKCAAKLVPYVQTKPIHGSQKVSARLEEHTVFQLELIPNYEFYQLMKSFGADMEVLSPPSVREKLARELQEAARQYNEPAR
jgi:predicted DNA-binding transcriptional regulator YafY